jgi:hypothetical protein
MPGYDNRSAPASGKHTAVQALISQRTWHAAAMTGQQSGAASPEPPAAASSAAPNLPSTSRDLGSRYRALTPYRKRRFHAIAGGGAVGLGIGIALAWIIGIYQRANPQPDITNAAGNTSQAFPAMGLTFFVVVIIAGSAIGLGLGYIAASLIPLDSERQGRLQFQELGQEAVHE